MRVLISGSTGFIGTELCEQLTNRGDTVLRLVRRPARNEHEISWNPNDGLIDKLPEVDAIVNLAAHSIGKRLTQAERARVLNTRTNGTKLLASTIAANPQSTKVFVNASAIGYYGSRGDEHLTEASAPGSSFLAGVVRAWEASANPAADAGVRTVFLRTGLVLGKRGGLLKKLLLPFRLGLGGPLGNGKQWMSWISIQDEAAAIIHSIENSNISGPVNVTAPNPVSNKEFTRELARTLHRPAILPVPKFALAALVGTELANEFVGSAYVVPEVLNQTDFKFRHATLAEALPEILGNG